MLPPFLPTFCQPPSASLALALPLAAIAPLEWCFASRPAVVPSLRRTRAAARLLRARLCELGEGSRAVLATLGASALHTH